MQELAPATQRDYLGYINRHLRAVFGETVPGDVHSGHIARYLQNRLDAGSGVVANREIACLSSVYNFGMRRGDCIHNPCRGVKRNTQKPRTRYVRDDEFLKAFEAASEPFQDFLASLYLTGFREQDLRSLRRNQLTPNGIRIEEAKTGKLRIVSWSESLRFFILRACSRVDGQFVFTNSHGKPWGQWAVQSVVRRLKGKIGHDWTLHDIRAKAESDHSEGLGLLPLYKRSTRVKPVR
jgi:integrase